MTTAGPWSVKGIDPKAREIAKDLARRSGLTLGEWLNQMITDTGESEAPPAPAADPWAEPPASLARGPDAPGFGAESFRSRLRDAGRAAEAAEMSRVTRALNDLSTRMEAAEHRSTLAISGIDQQVMGVLSRIEDGERGSATSTARFDGALNEVRRTQDQIASRIAAMGEHDGPRIEALKSLEASLTKMASQIYEGESRARAATAEVREDLSGLASRLDRAEARGSGAGTGGEAAFTRMMERLDAAEARTTAAVRGLETSFAGLDARLTRAEGSNLDQRFADLAKELQSKVTGERSGMAARLRDAADDPRLDRMEQVLRDMSGQVGRAEKRSADAIERMGHEVMRVAQSLSGRMDRVETTGVAVADRVSGEVARIAEAVEAHAQRGDDLQAKALERLGGEIARIAETLTQRIADSETRSSKALDALGDRLGHAPAPPMVESAPAPARTPDLRNAISAHAPTLSQFTAEPEFDAYHADPFASPDPFASIGGGAPPPPPTHRDPDLDFAPPPPLAADAPEADEPRMSEFRMEEPHAHEPRKDEPRADEDVFAPIVASEPSFAADPFEDYPPPRSEPPAPPRAPAPVHEPFETEDHGIFAPAPGDRLATESFDPRPRSSTRDLIEQARAAAREAADAKPRRGGRIAPEPVSVLAPAGNVEPKRGPFGLTLPTRRKREGGTLRSIAYASGVAVTLTVAAIGAANLAGHTSEEPGESPAAPSAAPVETASASGPAASTLAMALAPVDAPAPGMSGATAGTLATPLAAAPSAAAVDQARPLYSSGVRRLESGDAGGLADLRKAANLGLPEAQFHLANLYEEGQSGLGKDAAQARAWMARAAAGGDAKAMFNLGLFYANGDGGPHDDRQAVAWFRRAADLGLHDAQFNLAVMNQNGRGAPQSPAEAYKWFLIAAASGDSGAKASADALKPQIAPDALAAARRSAGAWRASQSGSQPIA